MASKLRSFTFGDVFQYNDNEYIFLAETEDVTYAAKILDRELSRYVIGERDGAIRRNSYVIDNLVYSFVILKTPELKERVALFLGADRNIPQGVAFTPLDIFLLPEDIKQIWKEITQTKCVSERLKKEVKDLKV